LKRAARRDSLGWNRMRGGTFRDKIPSHISAKEREPILIRFLDLSPLIFTNKVFIVIEPPDKRQ
jgi:hypothetical protein